MQDYYEKPKKKKKSLDKEKETVPKFRPVRNFKIIDDDIDMKDLHANEESEALVDLIDADRPVIVTDYEEEKPKVVQKVNYFTNNKWVKLDVCEDEDGDFSINNDQDTTTKFKKRGEKSNKSAEYDKNNDDDEDLDFIPRKRPTSEIKDSSNLSPVRRKTNSRQDDDLSPVRRRTNKQDEDGDLSPVRRRSHKQKEDGDLSPVRRNRKVSKEDSDDSSPIRRKNIKREDEDDLSISMRINRSTNKEEEKVDETKCRVRKLTKEEELKKKKKEEKALKYMEWGKGLVQKQQRDEKLKEDLYEADKPLARLKDDKDLDKLLKNVEREDDPMLEYLRSKKEGNLDEDGMIVVKTKATYKGPPPPLNRYNILPGSRWDGVDRSNGFEKRYYESIAKKKAIQEEAYKWSTEDM